MSTPADDPTSAADRPRGAEADEVSDSTDLVADRDELFDSATDFGTGDGPSAAEILRQDRAAEAGVEDDVAEAQQLQQRLEER
jgi:hypothetical protein